MKEAEGELNGTVIIVLAISVLIAFFYFTVWPLIRQNFVQTTQCSKAICNPCDNGATVCDRVTCHMKNDSQNTFECPYKG